jgi:hypothetical protein
MEEEFYCILKLVSGEELFSLISVDDSVEDPIIILQNPIVMDYQDEGSYASIKVEPWIKSSKEDIYFIRLSKVITMTESTDDDLIKLYERYNLMMNSDESLETSQKITDKMGYLGNVSDFKKNLELLFKLDTN